MCGIDKVLPGDSIAVPVLRLLGGQRLGRLAVWWETGIAGGKDLERGAELG